jgi:hypothetical protein
MATFVALAVAILTASSPTEAAHRKATMAAIEKQLTMPKDAKPINAYSRFYM